MAKGIKDKVAILGMGCTRFGERFDMEAQDLMVEAYLEAMTDAGIEAKQIDAGWLATGSPEFHLGNSALTLTSTLRLPYIPTTRVENFCASGTEAFRAAVYAVASGAADIAIAVGVEKCKDAGFGGLPPVGRPMNSKFIWPSVSAPGSFAQLATAYTTKFGTDPKDLKRAMAHISVKSHDNGSRNPKAHLRSKLTIDGVLNAPMIADPLGLFDCCGVSDGAACAIVTTPEIARSLGKKDLVSVKALQVAGTNGSEAQFNAWDGSYFGTTRAAAKRAYAEAGITDPRKELDLIEVHDCFSITELVTMEDLFISPEGTAVKDILDGFYDADGTIPCQIDGGLKCFGHPVGASGLRMIYENYLQILGRAGDRQRQDNPRIGLGHNVGGYPHQGIAAISIVGAYDK
jgi:acetyl-CoA C-acetyltransferase